MNQTLRAVKPDELAVRKNDFEKFVHTIAHDLRGTVRALTDIPQWLQEDIEAAGLALPLPILDNLDLMVRYSKRLDRMMEGLLTYSRIGWSQPTSRISPADILSELLATSTFHPSVAISHEILPCTVLIAKADIINMYEALISNAIKHNDEPSGKITISSKVDNEYIWLFFSDEGPGIDVKFHKDIFQIMTTLKSRDQLEGSGIGLASCKKICEHYGGKIWVESSPPNRGSTFGVILPLHGES